MFWLRVFFQLAFQALCRRMWSDEVVLAFNTWEYDSNGAPYKVGPAVIVLHRRFWIRWTVGYLAVGPCLQCGWEWRHTRCWSVVTNKKLSNFLDRVAHKHKLCPLCTKEKTHE